jgi:hypothetical protein
MLTEAIFRQGQRLLISNPLLFNSELNEDGIWSDVEGFLSWLENDYGNGGQLERSLKAYQELPDQFNLLFATAEQAEAALERGGVGKISRDDPDAPAAANGDSPIVRWPDTPDAAVYGGGNKRIKVYADSKTAKTFDEALKRMKSGPSLGGLNHCDGLVSYTWDEGGEATDSDALQAYIDNEYSSHWQSFADEFKQTATPLSYSPDGLLSDSDEDTLARLRDEFNAAALAQYADSVPGLTSLNWVSASVEKSQILLEAIFDLPPDSATEAALIQFIQGQMSDGWGEGESQQPLEGGGDFATYYLCFFERRTPPKVVAKAPIDSDLVALVKRTWASLKALALPKLPGVNSIPGVAKARKFVGKLGKAATAAKAAMKESRLSAVKRLLD